MRHTMPTYDVRNKESGEEKEVILSYDALQALLREGWEQIHKSSAELVTHHGSIIGKTSNDWKDLVKRIKKGSARDNTINV